MIDLFLYSLILSFKKIKYIFYLNYLFNYFGNKKGLIHNDY